MRKSFYIYPAALILLLMSGCRGSGGDKDALAKGEDPALVASRLLWERGRNLESDGNCGGALKAYRELVEDYPQSPLAPEAQFRIGICREAEDDLYAAFQAYQTLLDEFPGQGNLGEILRRQYEIGEAYLQGRKRWFLFLPIRSGLGRAGEIFRAVLDNATFSQVSPRAQFGLARSHQLRGDYQEAIFEYEQVFQNYPGSEVIAPALFQTGVCYYQEALRSDYDQRQADEALRYLQRFVRTFPDDPDRPRADEIIAELWDRKARKSYEIARYYEKQDSPAGARIYYREVAEKYPESEYAERARKKLEELPET